MVSFLRQTLENLIIDGHAVLADVARFRETDDKTPVVLMGYANPIERMGAEVFAKAAREAGVDGAEPGIIMPGKPQPGDSYRQEYYPGFAVDQARVLGSGGAITVPAGSYEKTLLTEETAPTLDPGGQYQYRRNGDVMVLPHTVIEAPERGRGWGEVLVRSALDDIRRQGYRIEPQCWFVAEFVDLNPEYADLVA